MTPTFRYRPPSPALPGALALLAALLLAVPAEAQNRVVTGTVTDAETGESLPSATVRVPGTTVGTTTGLTGEYRIEVPAGADTLAFSFVGYAEQRVSIAGRTTIDVALAPDVLAAEGVIVTALGIEREQRTLGYSVQEVEARELTEVPDANLVNSLQGKLAGVQITQSGTGAGGSSRVTIRGNRFIGDFGNQPLYVIDGLPINGGNAQPVGATGGIDYGGGAGDVDPNDIESITVLRGANAAALYGALAANGAILITTKKGSERTSASFSSTSTAGTPLVLPDLQNAYGRGSAGTVCGQPDCSGDPPDEIPGDISWGAPLNGQPVLTWTGEAVPYAAQPGNVGDFFDTSFSTLNSLAVSTGSQRATARFSLSNLQSGGLLPGNRLGRTNLALRASGAPTDRLSVDGSASYIVESAFNRPSLTTNPDNVVYNTYYYPRNLRLSDLENFRTPEGRPRIWTEASSFRQNPYWTVNLNTNEDERDRIIGLLRVQYTFAGWLSAFVRGGTDFSEVRREVRVATNTSYKPGGLGEYRIERAEVQQTNYDALVTAQGPLFDAPGGALAGQLSVGGNLRTLRSESVGHFGRGFAIPDLFTVSNLVAPEALYGFSEKEVRSLYALAQLSYGGTLFLDVTGRNDWSSSLPQGNNSYFYPSVTGSFFWSDLLGVPAVSYGKLRGSWARVGNDTEPYRTGLEYTLGVGHAGQPFGSLPIVLPLVDLKPQITNSFEGGADVGLWEDRLEASLTGYLTDTENQILRIPIASSSGYREGFVNAGTIRNWGVEALLSASPVRDLGGFGWDVSLNWAANRSQVVELTDDVTTYTLSSELGVSIVAEEGEPFGQIRGSRFLRNADGRRVIGADGLPVRAEDDVVLGNFQPDWIGGLSNTVRYRGLSLRALLDVRLGGDIFSLSNAVAAEQGTAAFTLDGREAWYAGTGGYVAEGVVNVGTDEAPVWEENGLAVDPQAYWTRVGGEDGVTEAFVYDGSYVKLREVALVYQVSPRLLARAPLRRASLSLVGRNLAVLHKNTPGFDPESSYNTTLTAQGREAFAFPPTRTVGLGLTLGF